MFIFSMVANIVTITVIAKSPKLMLSPFNHMIISLCVSNLLSTIYSPFVVYWKTFGLFEYLLPEIFCKSTFAIEYWTNSMTIQHILCFLAIRTVAIKYPHKLNKFTIQRAKMLICFIWFETALGNLILGMWLPHVYLSSELSLTRRTCAVHRSRWKYAGLFFYIGNPIFLFIPTFLIVILTVFLIGVFTKRMESIRERNRFTHLIYNLLKKRFDARSSWLSGMLAHILLRISECLNPVLYNLGSSQIREATMKFLRIGRNEPRENTIQLRAAKESTEQIN
ncbi:uncharacterized protein LOC120342632 isoform X2 [Styela clava]